MADEGVEIIKTKRAGWVWRCWWCDVTVASVADEVTAVEEVRAHVATVEHRRLTDG